jgi:hypothetical protein
MTSADDAAMRLGGEEQASQVQGIGPGKLAMLYLVMVTLTAELAAVL